MKLPCAKLKMEKDWVHLHDRLVTAASEIKATTTSSRRKFCVPDEIRRLACDTAKCRDTVRRRRLRKIAMRARREFEAGKAVLRRGKVINRPVITKFWGNGRASEDRDERREEVRAHCERCYDDKEETSEVRAERILSQREERSLRSPTGASGGDHGGQGSAERGKMLRNKANGPADCRVTEMLQCLSTETVYEVAHWFDKRFRGECRAPEAWKVLRLVFLKKT